MNNIALSSIKRILLMRKLIYSLLLCSFILLFTACGDGSSSDGNSSTSISPIQTPVEIIISITSNPINFPEESINWVYSYYYAPNYVSTLDSYVVEALGKVEISNIPNAYVLAKRDGGFYSSSSGKYQMDYCRIDIFDNNENNRGSKLYFIESYWDAREGKIDSITVFDILIDIIKTEPTKLYINHKVDVPVQ
jgi:hypothetical protein